MHETVKLDADDRKILTRSVWEVLLMNLAVGMVASVAAVGFAMLLEDAIPGFDRLTVLFVLVGAYLLYVLVAVLPAIRELRKGVKRIVTGVVRGKNCNDRYGSPGTVAAFANQVKMVEYFLTVDNTAFRVDEECYRKFNPGDRINIHYSVRTGGVIRMAHHPRAPETVLK